MKMKEQPELFLEAHPDMELQAFPDVIKNIKEQELKKECFSFSHKIYEVMVSLLRIHKKN